MAAPRASWLKRLDYTWIAAAVILLVSIGEAAAQTKEIVILHSFDRNFEPGAKWSQEIRNQLSLLQSPWPLEIQEFSIVKAVKSNDAADAKFVEYLEALYAQRPPDLIIAIDGPAALFVQQHKKDLYSTTPMLLAAVEVRRVEQSTAAFAVRMV